jgi:hypothetical protein
MVFAGWYNGETLFDFDTEIEDNLTLTAKWEAAPLPKVTVTLKSGDDIVGTPIEINKGSKIESPAAPEAPAGIIFAGWYNGETLFDFDTEIEENITLVASWIDASALFSVLAKIDGNLTIDFDFGQIKGGEEISSIKELFAGENGEIGYSRLYWDAKEEQSLTIAIFAEEENYLWNVYDIKILEGKTTTEWHIYLKNGSVGIKRITTISYENSTPDEVIVTEEENHKNVEKILAALQIAEQVVEFVGGIDVAMLYNQFVSIADYSETEQGYEYSLNLQLSDIANLLASKFKTITAETTAVEFVFDLFDTFIAPEMPITPEEAKELLMTISGMRFSEFLVFASEMSGFSVQELSGLLMALLQEQAPEYMELIGPMLTLDPTIEGLILTIMQAPFGATIGQYIDRVFEFSAVDALTFLYRQYIGTLPENANILPFLQFIPAFEEFGISFDIFVDEIASEIVLRVDLSTITTGGISTDFYFDMIISGIGTTIAPLSMRAIE